MHACANLTCWRPPACLISVWLMSAATWRVESERTLFQRRCTETLMFWRRPTPALLMPLPSGCSRDRMELCIARDDVYRLLFMSPLIRKISACCATRSGRSRNRTCAQSPTYSLTLSRNISHCIYTLCAVPSSTHHLENSFTLFCRFKQGACLSG